MKKKIIIYYNRIQERLWFRPLIFCLISVAAALIAHQADETQLNDLVPIIKSESIEGLLDILSSSMLVISIFAVASMLSAYSAASTTATPRSFKIVITDDVSQYALSTFIGAFIFSIVATVAMDNGYYNQAGKFILFLITLVFFAVVILTFLRWVDSISRLGRLERTIMQVEAVAAKSLSNYIKNPLLNALPITGKFPDGKSVLADSIGYVEHINMHALQDLAKEMGLKIRLNCLPGKFIHKNFVIAFISSNQDLDMSKVTQKLNDAIHVGHTRLFPEDPRFGLLTLAEIASRALSTGINDPGTAIQIITSQERLLFLWNDEIENSTEITVLYDCIEVPQISMEELFDDAFRSISRDGAGYIEVMLRLQKTFNSLETINDAEIKAAAIQYSKYAFNSAELAIKLKHDLDILEKQCLFSYSRYAR
ncbi:DUF2254 domain-containing protein [Salegentibacter salegens]|uniref:Uncharacterized membrane protein n=1 Tax=Salegentibacter salegens TaxID=143223 RepID=A0A1M7IB37_9FLAO|nr:DUF2254 domain-containing protein [Salegentibacter salegens]PRX48016.1 putative membrane protein [Salegentibacter salegens]SHM37964.1 Uncharacterized membrane protein [Salegentibacter salegens]